MINGARLKQARESRKETQASLAEKVGLPQSVISRLEIGTYPISNDDVIRIANSLEIPVGFLFRSPVELPEGSLGLFRSHSSKVAKNEYSEARRLAEIGIESILRLAEGVNLPATRIESVPDADPETAAQYARAMLRLSPDEPIDNLTVAMERAGILMLRLSNISESINGFSAWIDPIPKLSTSERAIVVTKRPMSAFRLRFTLGHELGHLILRHQVFTGPQQPVERDANRFAQALLIPRDAALEDLSATSLNLERLAELKSKWGVSMHAIAMRAKGLEIISEAGYRSIYETLRMHGYLKVEPGDVRTQCEQPRLLAELMHRKGMHESPYELASEMNHGLEHAKSILGSDTSDKNIFA